jgi:serine/threonine protein kinase
MRLDRRHVPVPSTATCPTRWLQVQLGPHDILPVVTDKTDAGLVLPKPYRRLARVGEGGFGQVWEVEVEGGERYVAKAPLTPLDTELLRRFRREVRLQSQIEHVNVVPILDFDLDADPPWFIMPLAVASLQDKMPQLQVSQALDLFRQAAQGVAYAHKNKVIHRDLKPSNILLFGTDRPGLSEIRQ